MKMTNKSINILSVVSALQDHLKAWLMPRGLYAAELEVAEKPPQCAGFDFSGGPPLLYHACGVAPLEVYTKSNSNSRIQCTLTLFQALGYLLTSFHRPHHHRK